MTQHNLVVGNAVGVEFGEKFGERILSAAFAPRHRTAVAVIVEADGIDLTHGRAPLNLRDQDARRQLDLDRIGYRHRPNNDEKDGTFVGWDKAIAREYAQPVWEVLTTNEWSKNGVIHHEKMNTRWALTVSLEFYMPDGTWRRQKPLTGLHFPPPRYPVLRQRASDQAVGFPFFAGDLNLGERWLRRRYPGRIVRGTEVIHVVTRDVDLGKSKKITLADSDHPGIVVPMRFAR